MFARLTFLVPVVAAGLLSSASLARAGDGPSYTIDDVTACSKDALRLCRELLSDLDAVEGCMKTHFEQLSPKCQARFQVERAGGAK